MRGKTRAEIRLLQRDEMKRILNHMPSRTQLPAEIAVNLGLTGPEVFSLEWQWVDLSIGEVFVKWSPYVTGRYVLMSEAIVHRFRTHKNKGGLSTKVFTKPDGKPFWANALSHDFKAACLTVGIPNGSFGDVRLSNAKWLLDAGVPLTLVSARLGMNRHTLMRHFVATPQKTPKDIRGVLDSLTVLSRDSVE